MLDFDSFLGYNILNLTGRGGSLPPRLHLKEKQMSKIKEICEEKFAGMIAEMGYELLDVEYVKENGGMSLIFTIDSEDGVGIDDCETVSK